MPTYLGEKYWPGVTENKAAAALERLLRAADDLAQRGIEVRCVQTIFVPSDESVLWMFEADTAAEVHRCASDADVTIDRLTESVRLLSHVFGREPCERQEIRSGQ